MSESANILRESAAAPSGGPILDRPFYFIVVLWGERFRDCFLEYCLPSLLSAGNIPALSTRQPSKFLIATYPEDWSAMRATPIFRELERYVEPVLIEIPRCPPGRSGCEHMGVGHKSACEMAYRAKAYGMVLTPDCMLSDGSIARLQALAMNGAEIVLTAALRFGEEPFLGHLREMGAIPTESRRDSGKALAINSRQMVYAAVNGLHSETMCYEWEQPYFAQLPSAAWWKIPGEDGMLVHSLSWAPLLLDYAAVREHDTSTLENWTIDGDYLFKNLARTATIYVVRDSDEMFLASWAPLAERPLPLEPHPIYLCGPLGRVAKGATFRSAFKSATFDPLKRRIFLFPVRWHARPVNENWAPVEERSRRTLRFFVGAPNNAHAFRLITGTDGKTVEDCESANSHPHPATPKRRGAWGPFGAYSKPGQIRDGDTIREFLSRKLDSNLYQAARLLLDAIFDFVAFVSRMLSLLIGLWIRRRLIGFRLGMALNGDRDARRWLLWRIRVIGDQILNRPPYAPMPCPPPESRAGWR